jgi:hypothetical protein
MYVQAAGWEVAAAARKAAASKVSHDPAMSCEKKKDCAKKRLMGSIFDLLEQYLSELGNIDFLGGKI